MKISEQLRKAKELILAPEKWTQKTFENKDGAICASHAISIVYASIHDPLRIQHDAAYLHGDAYAMFCKANDIQMCGVANFNDTSTHEEVLAAFDKAIAAAEQINQ